MEEEKILKPIIFTHEEFGAIRTFKQDGKILFSAADVCAKLDIQNTSQAVEDFDEDEKMTISTKYSHNGQRGGAQYLIVVTEPGLYKLIFRSRKPEAKKFQHWVTEEVLPALRQTDTSNAEESMKSLIFTHEEFGEIHTFWIDGNPYFIGKEVATKLGYKDTDKAIRDHLKNKHKLTRQIGGSGQNRNMTLISEAGLYTLILKSTLPAAEKFQDWVTEEVLPSLRKTGSYTMPGNDDAKTVNIYFGGFGNMSEDSSEKWLKEKSGENLVRLAKVLGSKDLTSEQEFVLQKAFWFLTGEHFPVQKEKQQE